MRNINPVTLRLSKGCFIAESTSQVPFDKPGLRMPTGSFENLRTNGWHIEGLRANGT